MHANRPTHSATVSSGSTGLIEKLAQANVTLKPTNSIQKLFDSTSAVGTTAADGGDESDDDSYGSESFDYSDDFDD